MRNRGPADDSNRNRSFLTRSNLRGVVVVCSIMSSLFLHPNVLLAIVGVGFLTLGCLIHVVSKGVLIRNEVLCRKGMYAIVRHPYYLANYLIDTSLCLLTGNVYLLLFYPFLFFWAYGPTIRKEEQFLMSRYGELFVTETLRVPQVFPDRLLVHKWKYLLEGFSVKRITHTEYSRLARFWFFAGLILLMQRMNAVNLIQPSLLLHQTVTDYRQFSLVLVTIFFFCVNVGFMMRTHIARRKGGRKTNYFLSGKPQKR